MQTKRIVILAASLVVSYAAVSWVRSANDRPPSPPDVELANIPLQLGEWSGEEVEIQDDTVQVLKAHSFINRSYRDPVGQLMGVHLAIWADGSGSLAPHHPEICYPAAGWELMARRTTEFSTAYGNYPIELLQFKRDGQQVVVGVWFQAGASHYVNSGSLQAQLFLLWGQKDQPAVIKVMLQSQQPTLDAAEPEIAGFAAMIVDAIEQQRASNLEASRSTS
jgi:EpsI family protein